MSHYYGDDSLRTSTFCNNSNFDATFYENCKQGIEKSPFKSKTYLNPRIINCEYVKQSLYQGRWQHSNTIHFNPNFKPTEPKISLEKIPNASLTTKKTVLPSKSQDTVLLPQYCKVPCLKLTSQYKVINKINLSENHINSQSKCTLPKASNKNKLHHFKFSKIANSQNSSLGIKHNKIINFKVQNPTLKDRFKFFANKVALKASCPTIEQHSKQINPTVLSKTKLVTLNGKKLINKVVSKQKLNLKLQKKAMFIKNYQNQSKFYTNKTNTTVKAAALVKNKYIYNKKTNLIRKSKYKIDKRKDSGIDKKQTVEKTSGGIRNLFPAPSKFFYSNYYLMPAFNYFSGSKSCTFWRNNFQCEKKNLIKPKSYSNKKIVNIGGILYKSTSNKLTIANSLKKKKFVYPLNKFKIARNECNKNYVVYVKGEKFLLDKNGKTLKRQECNFQGNNTFKKFKRIDIGGVTYLQRSQNLLIRTNIHNARHIVTQAKHKSIATLCHLKKKSALPCMIYHKFGKCLRHSKGICIYRHDPKNIALCKRFLKGQCNDKKCLLSHEAIKEKMATCLFFLSGCCNTENCPFLHVKLNKNVAICKDFLNGFCNLGQNCSKRHLYQCPEFEKFGKCSFRKYCPYPHRAKEPVKSEDIWKSNDIIKYEVKKIQTTKPPLRKKEKRPILKLNDKKEKGSEKAEKKPKKNKLKLVISDQISDALEFVPKRIKLEKLPSYIPLNVNK